MRAALALCVAAGCGGDPGIVPTVTFVELGDAQIRIVVGQPRDIDSIFAGDIPTDADWYDIRVPRDREADLRTFDGVIFDLAVADAGVTYADVYQDYCNPATGDMRTCEIHESYAAGDAGLTGTMTLQLTDTEISAAFDWTFRGLTDRYGPPTQMCHHENAAGFDTPYTLR